MKYKKKVLDDGIEASGEKGRERRGEGGGEGGGRARFSLCKARHNVPAERDRRQCTN